jgi:long-subunit fatty acid transport protein
MLWNLTPRWTIGAVYKAPFHADVRHKEVYSVEGTNPVPKTTIIDQEQTLKMPPSYGIGIAYRFSDLFSMDLDIYRTEWDQFVLVQEGGRRVSLFTGGPRSETDTEATHQIRLGGEYLHIYKNQYVIAGRAGLFYDPEPTAHSPDDFFGFSVGTGVAAGPVVVDMAYAFRFGNDVREVTLLDETAGQDVRQHTVYLSMIYHF